MLAKITCQVELAGDFCLMLILPFMFAFYYLTDNIALGVYDDLECGDFNKVTWDFF